jgi:cell division protein FtsB
VAASDKKKQRSAKKPNRSLTVSLQASGFTATVLALIVTGVVVLSPSLQVLAEQRQQIAQLEAQLAETDAEVLRLEDQLERWNDRVFVETQARSRLMFVYPGDITYLVLDDLPEDDSNGDAIVSEDIQLAQPNWRESLLASYLVAATTSTMVSASDAPEQDTSLLPSPSEGSEERPEQ